MPEINLLSPPAIYGSAVAGESATVRRELESLIDSVNASNFDIGERLSHVFHSGFFREWGFNTFGDYTATLKIKPRKAQYLKTIVDCMKAVGVKRSTYEPLGIARLREIASLDPVADWTNPTTGEITPMKEFILGFIEQGETYPLDDLKKHVRTLKGLVGENDLVWLNFCLKRSVLDETGRPALELAKRYIGSVGKDEDGISKDASDGAAFEVLAIEYLNDPANHVTDEQ
jgi:hypothetical protein